MTVVVAAAKTVSLLAVLLLTTASYLLAAESVHMENSHLFYNGRFTRLSGP